VLGPSTNPGAEYNEGGWRHPDGGDDRTVGVMEMGPARGARWPARAW
jgi:hypothetical protein